MNASVWINKNYERVALLAGVLVLLATALGVFYRASEFGDEFGAAQTRPPQRPAGPPGKASELGAAAKLLRNPPQWTFRGRSGLFVPERHFIGANGEPATLENTQVHPPVPNEWFELYGLPITDGDVLDQDADNDGFSNLDEWQGHTNPIDAKSHPDYVAKLKLRSAREEPFPFIFASRTGDTFGINNIDERQPTQFVKVGDTLAGSNFRLAAFQEKHARDQYGTDVDVSELTLQNNDTHQHVTLIKERVAVSPESVATFVYLWGQRREIVVKKDQEFSLPPENDVKYRLIDVQPRRAVIVSNQRPDVPIEIGPLNP